MEEGDCLFDEKCMLSLKTSMKTWYSAYFSRHESSRDNTWFYPCDSILGVFYMSKSNTIL